MARTTMRAYQLRQAGQMPDVVELAIPEPGPRQVRLRMAGAGLCHSDLLVINASPSYYPLPLIMGHEATGWIDAVGAQVQGLNLGDAYGVYFPWGCGHCAPCSHGAENICDTSAQTPGFATGRDGGMAEYFIVDDPRHLVALGDIDPVAAAPLMCAGITAYHAVEQSGHVLVSGATFEIRRATGGLGAAAVLDFVGNDRTLELGSKVLAQGGMLQIIGVGGGTLPIRFHEMPRDTSVTLPYAGTISDLRGVVDLAAAGRLAPDVLRIGFDQLNDTYQLMDSGKLKGRAVLVP